MKSAHDPVCGMEVEAESAAGRSSYAGQVYYFCSSSCQAKFDADPAKFIELEGVGAHQRAASDRNTPEKESRLGAVYTCPMHPEIERDQPGDCPICGMALELKTISADSTEDNSELIDMTRRFWIGAALTLPVFLLAMSHLVRILPIGDEPALLEYARLIQTELRAHQVRCELDASSDHMKTKIANAEQMKVNTMLVIGNRDMEANAVSVRVHGQGNLGAKPRDQAVAEILSAIRQRR